jgi:hypothetical protein
LVPTTQSTLVVEGIPVRVESMDRSYGSAKRMAFGGGRLCVDQRLATLAATGPPQEWAMSVIPEVSGFTVALLASVVRASWMEKMALPVKFAGGVRALVW